MFFKKEIWKDIINYEGIYQVSDNGRIKSLKFGKENIMKLKKWKNGYMRIDLCKNGKKKYCLVHRLVANAFISNPENKPCNNHIDGNKKNNNIKNLEWATYSENMIHAYRTGLAIPPYTFLGKFGKEHPRSKPVNQYTLQGKFIKSFNSIAEASRETNICVSSISRICNGSNSPRKQYIWEFKQ